MSVECNIPFIMDHTKIMMAHIATEIIVIGGISFLFHKRISDLNIKVSELEKKLEKVEKCEKCEGCTGESGGINTEQFQQFQQQTTQHINNIYSAIRQIANTINGSPPPLENQSPIKSREDQIKEMKQAQLQMREAQMREVQMREAQKKQQSQQSVSNPSFTLSLTPENTNGGTKLELIEEEKKEISDHELDDELEDELKDLSNPINRDENDIKNNDNNTTQETPLEFLQTKGKKLVKKKK